MTFLLYSLALSLVLAQSVETFHPHSKYTSSPSAALVGGICPGNPSCGVAEQLNQKWTDLGERQKEYERGLHTQAEAYRLARDMLELALTTVKIAEENEYEHAVEAGQKLEKAVHQEYVLNKAAQTAHKEAQEAFDQDKSFDRHDLANSDEWEKYRQLVSFEMARRVEEYVQDRLNDARAAEGAAKLEEQVADLHLLELMEKADELRVFLNQLEQQPKKAQKSQEIRHPVLDCE